MDRAELGAALVARGFEARVIAEGNGTSLWHHGDREYVTHEVGPFEDGFVVTAWDRTDGPVCLYRYEGPPPATPADLDAILRACGVERPERRVADEPWCIPCKLCEEEVVGEMSMGMYILRHRGVLSTTCPYCMGGDDREMALARHKRLSGRRVTDWREP